VKALFISLLVIAQLAVACSTKPVAAQPTAATNTTESIKPIPTSYGTAPDQAGSVVQLDYTAHASGSTTTTRAKHALVYLPYNYDKTRPYNVFYLLHGGGGSAEVLLGGAGQSTALKNLLDNMIAQGELAPLIVVAPTFYQPGNTDNGIAAAGELTKKFPQEVLHDLLPAVEGRYHTYAASTTPAGLCAARTHRAFGGFSMGAVTTWYTFIEGLDYFKYFMPLSGDSWVIAQQGGASRPDETAAYLHNVVAKSKYGPRDFFIYALTGSGDIAYTAMNNQIAAMKKFPDRFVFNNEPSKGSIRFDVLAGGVHSYPYVLRYIYNALPAFWPKK
jgi:enterochelin esterase-like enzyme